MTDDGDSPGLLDPRAHVHAPARFRTSSLMAIAASLGGPPSAVPDAADRPAAVTRRRVGGRWVEVSRI